MAASGRRSIRDRPVAFPGAAVLAPVDDASGGAMPTEVEAQITGNVWKIEKAVGDAGGRGRRI